MKELSKDDILALERKLDSSKKEKRKKVMVDMDVYESLLALSKGVVDSGKPQRGVIFNITVEENGDHVQVYKHDKNTTAKLGNIWKTDDGMYEADDGSTRYGKMKWQNFTRALAYIISPRGMS